MPRLLGSLPQRRSGTLSRRSAAALPDLRQVEGTSCWPDSSNGCDARTSAYNNRLCAFSCIRTMALVLGIRAGM